MYIIAGLGNPTSKYDGTRHNVGFDVIDEIAKRNNINMDIKKHKALCGKGMIGSEKVILVKPETFMNLSGESIRSVLDFYKEDTDNIIIIYDDISLEVGRLRIRGKGSAGGHNGIKSIIAHIGTDVFKRIRVGVGEKPAGYDLADYVLSRFDAVDRVKVDKGIQNAAMAAETMVTDSINQAMNQFN